MRDSSWFQSWPCFQALRLQAQHSWSVPGASPKPRPTQVPHSHPLLLVQVPDQFISLVHQRHQLLQQELLPVLLRNCFLPL